MWYTMLFRFSETTTLFSLRFLLHCLLNQSGQLQNQNLHSPDETTNGQTPSMSIFRQKAASGDRNHQILSSLCMQDRNTREQGEALKLNYNEKFPSLRIMDPLTIQMQDSMWLILARLHGAVLARTDPSQIQPRHRSHADC